MKLSILVVVATAIITCTVASLLGGLRKIEDVEKNPGLQKAVSETLELFRDRSRNDVTLVNIISAHYKIIAGIEYHINLEIKVNNEKRKCAITVVHRADIDGQFNLFSEQTDPCYSLMYQKSVVQNRKRRSSLLGAKEDLNLNEQNVKDAANWAVNHINGMSNSFYRQALLRIADGWRQVVNGLKYRFLLYMVSTTCRNNDQNYHKGLKECPTGDKPMRQQCDTTVLFSGGKYSMLNFNCKPLKIKNMIGGDDHDYKPHGNLIGGDDHDYKPHGNLIGGDDHDYKPHGNLIGGDDHDYKPHGNLIGGDDHDYKPHGKINLLGRDWHDYIPHLKINSMLNAAGKHAQEKLQSISKDILKHGKDALEKTNVLGGDTHDYQPHRAEPCEQYRAVFEEFKSKHQRLYASPKVEAEKFQIFCGNMERVKEYQKIETGSAVYGATIFADMSEKEFKDKYLGWKMNERGVKNWPSAEIPKGPIPDSWDWRDHNAVTPVKNQGSCGSCWAFSTTGNIEGRNALKNKKLVSLSEQELVDCDKIDEGCNGGLPSQAYEAIMELGGLETEKDYSYDGEREKCQFKKSEVAVKVVGALNVSQDEGEMAAWLYHNGPISIGINAFAMQFYMGGIAHPWRVFCNPKSLDHGVLIVGYGKEGNEPYWIVKNSWGSHWGREGYYYVYRGDGVCGLNMMCTSAIVE